MVTAMKSPFPGFDPYLQECWSSVHARLITYAADAISEQLPPDLVARTEERVFLECESERLRHIVPDVHMRDWRTSSSVVREDTGGAALAEPVCSVRVAEEEITESYIEIRDARGRQVVTVIEIVSPANKAEGEGRRQYLQKQEDVMQSGTTLVEIDFIRGGSPVLMGGRKAAAAAGCASDALAAAHMPWRRGLVDIYAFPLRERLKAMRIPLRSKDEPVTLDLQALLEKTYAAGRYGLTIDYDAEPVPPLPAADAAWADALLRQAGARTAPAAAR